MTARRRCLTPETFAKRLYVARTRGKVILRLREISPWPNAFNTSSKESFSKSPDDSVIYALILPIAYSGIYGYNLLDAVAKDSC